jgi:hypothetical protein
VTALVVGPAHKFYEAASYEFTIDTARIRPNTDAILHGVQTLPRKGQVAPKSNSLETLRVDGTRALGDSTKCVSLMGVGALVRAVCFVYALGSKSFYLCGLPAPV